MKKPFVLSISGPTGIGKTTLSKMLVKHYNCAYISEDEVARGIFPENYKDLENYPDKLRECQGRLLTKIKQISSSGKSVVVDQINLDKELIKEMKKTFKDHLMFKVLWPAMKTAIERDKLRADWTSGEIAVKGFYGKYEKLKLILGQENFIDNNDQTPDETLGILINLIEHN